MMVEKISKTVIKTAVVRIAQFAVFFRIVRIQFLKALIVKYRDTGNNMGSNTRFRWSSDIQWPFKGDRKARLTDIRGGSDEPLWGRLHKGATLTFSKLDRFNVYGIWLDGEKAVSPDFDPPVIELWLRRSRPSFISLSGFLTLEIYTSNVGWVPSGGIYAAFGEPAGYFRRASLHSEARVYFKKENSVMVVDDDAPRYGPSTISWFNFIATPTLFD